MITSISYAYAQNNKFLCTNQQGEMHKKKQLYNKKGDPLIGIALFYNNDGGGAGIRTLGRV